MINKIYALANFLAVFNDLEIIGKILTFCFASFSKEFYMFNYIIKDRLFIKNNKKNKFLYISNPLKIIIKIII